MIVNRGSEPSRVKDEGSIEIAVFGGGHGCYADAVDLSEQGHSIGFWRRDRRALKDVLASGSLINKDFRGEREVAISTVTTHPSAANGGAALVVMPPPFTAHGALPEELATVVQYNIGRILLVFNNGAFGNVRRGQINCFIGRIHGSELCTPDFMALAHSVKARGYK